MKLLDIIFESVVDLNEHKSSIGPRVGNLLDKWKGKSAAEFYDDNPDVYEWAVKKGPFIIDPITNKKKNTKGFWENLIKDMDQTELKNRLDNRKKNPPIPKEEIIKVAKEFGNGLVSDFKKKFPTYYQSAIGKGPHIKVEKNKYKNTYEFFYEVTKNMVRTVRDPFTDDELREIAKKYVGKTFKDFRDGDPNAYSAALDRGPCTDGNKGPCKEKDNRKNTYEFFKEITKGIEPTGSYSAKMVYVYEFRDENNNKVAAYVGLTDKEEVRHKEHMTGVTREGKDIKTAVTKFIEENPNLHFTKLKITDGYIDWKLARELEDEYEKKYAEDGWEILNVAKTGSLGRSFGVSNDELKKRFDKYNTIRDIRKKDNSAYNTARTRGILDDLTKNYKKLAVIRTDQELTTFALKYNTFDDFKKDKKAESVKVILRNRGLLPKIIELFKEKGDNPVYKKQLNRGPNVLIKKKTDQEIIDFALKYNTFDEFKKDEKVKIFKVEARNRKLLPKIIELFKERGDNPVYHYRPNYRKPNYQNKPEEINESKLSFGNILKQL
jgi:hypothetical protein